MTKRHRDSPKRETQHFFLAPAICGGSGTERSRWDSETGTGRLLLRRSGTQPFSATVEQHVMRPEPAHRLGLEVGQAESGLRYKWAPHPETAGIEASFVTDSEILKVF